MIEILFTESGAGSLKASQTFSDRYDDVFCFGLAWDIGDISEEGVDEKRLAVLDALYSIYDEDTQKAAKILLPAPTQALWLQGCLLSIFL